ncbi:MAG: PQQ-dependent sugar dehydrogenase, partial [Acidobacteriota bacterium]
TPAAPAASTLGSGPWTYTTYERNTRVQVSVVAHGLSHPWGLAFLPDGSMLITERPGKLRVLHNGVLSPDSVADFSKLSVDVLFDIALHPKFAENGLVYFTYMKKGPRPDGTTGYWATTAVARGRFDGQKMGEIKDVFLADAWQPLSGGDGARIAFAPDGTMYVSSSHRRNPDAPQMLNSDVGKILRLNDDGSIPKDNPFVGQAGKKPEIFSYGHRTVLGLTFHPVTKELWETENGPQGGDEVNIIRAGKNYGWPVVTYGRDYDGKKASPTPWRADMEAPELFWVPSVTASGIMFYTGDKIPSWKNNLFVGAMTVGRLAGTGNLQRIVFNADGEQRRETLLGDLKQRIRDVRQGPDGLIYLLTDENDGAVLKIEPAK